MVVERDRHPTIGRPRRGFACRSLALAVAASLAFALFPALADTPAFGCGGPQIHQDATSSTIGSFIQGREKRVLTFAGYSGAGYQDAVAMLHHAEQVLDGYDPAEVLVNIGATADGIGAVYEVAKRKGFTTLGIVSSLALAENVPLSPCVDHVFFVNDASWGGKLPNSSRLSPTSAAIVANSTIIVGIGGGEIARDEMLAAKRLGKQVRFISADLNHERALQKAARRGEIEPTDFRGAAHTVFGKGN